MNTASASAEAWFTRFREQLTIRGWSGRRIGDAVATVDSHCRDAQVTPESAFGDPVAYATSLAGPDIKRWAVFARQTLPDFLGVASLYALFHHQLENPVAVRWGSLLGLACGAIFGPFFVPALMKLRPKMRLARASFFSTLIALAIGSAAVSLVPGVAFHLPLWLVWVLIAVTLSGSLLTSQALANAHRRPPQPRQTGVRAPVGHRRVGVRAGGRLDRGPATDPLTVGRWLGHRTIGGMVDIARKRG